MNRLPPLKVDTVILLDEDDQVDYELELKALKERYNKLKENKEKWKWAAMDSMQELKEYKETIGDKMYKKQLQAESDREDLVKLIKELKKKNRSLETRLHSAKCSKVIYKEKYKNKKAKLSAAKYKAYKLQKHIDNLPSQLQEVQEPDTQTTVEAKPPTPPPIQYTISVVLHSDDADRAAICVNSTDYEECWKHLKKYEKKNKTIEGFVVPESLRIK